MSVTTTMVAATYLDANATAPLRPAARAAMVAALDVVGNPSSVHRDGRAARRVVEDARDQVARLVDARSDQVVFTSGGTEANNLALKGVAGAAIFISAIEHDSVLAAAPQAPRLPVDRSGIVDLAALEAALARTPRPALVSVMLANNETGVIQPVAEIARLVHGAEGYLHCDAVQGVGRMAVDIGALGVDALTVSAHKLGGPRGVGALVVGERYPLRAIIQGGGQERGRRAGTENVAAIVGFGAAAELARAELHEPERQATLRDALEARARSAVPSVIIAGEGAPRLANTSCLILSGMPAETQVIALDLAGVAVSAGAACSSGKVRASHVLSAMGLTPDEAKSAIRVSLGWHSTPKDIDHFIEAWTALARRTGNAGASEIVRPAA